MRPKQKGPITIKQMEKSISNLLKEHSYSAVNADGKLSDHFILHYLIRNNDAAAKAYAKILCAYEEVKKEEVFARLMQGKRVKKETLARIVLDGEAIVRPLPKLEGLTIDGIMTGKILKLGKRRYEDGEDWKASLEREDKYKVGDTILYYVKTNIILDDELLHLVSYCAGKITE